MSEQATVNLGLSGRATRRTWRVVTAINNLPYRLLLWLLATMARQWQNIVTALVQIWANIGRAILTTLGIIIAVTSTITVVSW